MVSHVDDFLCIGPRQALRWFSQAIKDKYEIKVNELSEENREVAFLGRRIRWSEEGIDRRRSRSQTRWHFVEGMGS